MAREYHRATIGDLKAFDEKKVLPQVRAKLDEYKFFQLSTYDPDRSTSLRTLETEKLGTVYIKTITINAIMQGTEGPEERVVTVIDLYDAKGLLRVSGVPSGHESISWHQAFTASDGTTRARPLIVLSDSQL